MRKRICSARGSKSVDFSLLPRLSNVNFYASLFACACAKLATMIAKIAIYKYHIYQVRRNKKERLTLKKK